MLILRSRNSAEAQVAAACKGLGLVYLPIYILRGRLDSGELVRLLEDYMVGDMATWLVYPYRRFLPARVSLLINHLIDHFKDWRE